MNSYQICIDDLIIDAWVGIHPHEQKFQPIVLDSMIVITSKIGIPFDNIDKTLNYEDIIIAIQKLCKNNKYQLLETLGDEICKLLLSFKQVKSVEIKVGKQKILGCKQISIRIKRIKRSDNLQS